MKSDPILSPQVVAHWWLCAISGLKLHPLLISKRLKWQRLEGPNVVLLEMYSLFLLSSWFLWWHVLKDLPDLASLAGAFYLTVFSI